MSETKANPAKNFIQLTNEQCKYLLDLIEDMDSETQYTERQRSYTVPKLERILKDPSSTKLATQDVSYLIELVQDDELQDTEELIAARESTMQALLAIQRLQKERYRNLNEIENQRAYRKSLRGQKGY